MESPTIYKSQAGKQAVLNLYDSILDRWPLPYRTVTVPTSQGSTFIIESGRAEGPPLVLLHGASSNAVTWAGDVARYGPHYRVYAVDLPGEPNRSAPNRPPWEGPAFALWLQEVLDRLEIAQAILVGLSQGAWVALKLAVTQPERVSKLVLLTPGGIVPDKLTFLVRFILLSPLGRWGRRRINRMLFASAPVAPEVEDGMALIMRHFKPRIGTLPLFDDADLSRMTMPVLLLVGAEDALRDGRQIAARLRPLLPRLQVEIIPGAGHALMNTPDRVLPFLADTQAAATACVVTETGAADDASKNSE